jgi:hypothetical protein
MAIHCGCMRVFDLSALVLALARPLIYKAHRRAYADGSPSLFLFEISLQEIRTWP